MFNLHWDRDFRIYYSFLLLEEIVYVKFEINRR